VLGWVVGGIRDECVGEGGFPVYGVTHFEGVLWIVMSRKFSLLLGSILAVNFMLGWIMLKCGILFDSSTF
jgi:hypothetical protein